MSSPIGRKFPRVQHECDLSIDPRVNDNAARSLVDKTALVVGAGRGIGRACCEFLVLAGVRSLACLALEVEEAEDTAKICKNLKPTVEVIALGVDNRILTDVERVVEEVANTFGAIDNLLMNAGRPPQFLPTSLSDREIWWQTMSVSLRGAFNFSRAVLPFMQRQKRGCIVFTSSSGAHINTEMSAYLLAKLVQVRLAEILHVENFQQYGIKAFAFNPGCVRTRFFTDFEDNYLGEPALKESYAGEGDLENLSARKVYNALKDEKFDSPYMAAGLVIILASGKLDFMFGKYLDAAVKVEHYLNSKDDILRHDLCRVRLVLDSEEFLSRCDF